jgi:hypothetical protein
MAWELRIDSKIQDDMLGCDDGARQEIERFVKALEDNAYPSGCEEIEPLMFFCKLQCGYFISWEAIPDRSRALSIKDPRLAAVRVLGVGRNPPRRRSRSRR